MRHFLSRKSIGDMIKIPPENRIRVHKKRFFENFMVGYFDFSPRDLRIKRCNLMQNDRDGLLFIDYQLFLRENFSYELFR